MLLDLVKKTKQTHVLLVLAKCVFVTRSFDLWMSKAPHDVFALVLNFLEKHWMPKHITICLFQASKKSKQTLTRSL
jgi:hypothetical protein